jgi:hypothetical protein
LFPEVTPITLQELEVNMDNYQILRLRPGLNVSANEKPVELAAQAVVQIADEAGVLLAQLQALHTPERIISVALPAHGFHMLYTGSSTLVTVSYLRSHWP